LTEKVFSNLHSLFTIQVEKRCERIQLQMSSVTVVCNTRLPCITQLNTCSCTCRLELLRLIWTVC